VGKRPAWAVRGYVNALYETVGGGRVRVRGSALGSPSRFPLCAGVRSGARGALPFTCPWAVNMVDGEEKTDRAWGDCENPGLLSLGKA